MNIFTTMANHPGLLRRYLPFGGKLLNGGSIDARQRELLILRTGWNAGSDYEWGQHVRIGLLAGLTEEEIERVAAGPAAEGWSADDATLLTACDELCTDHVISDPTWAALTDDPRHQAARRADPAGRPLRDDRRHAQQPAGAARPRRRRLPDRPDPDPTRTGSRDRDPGSGSGYRFEGSGAGRVGGLVGGRADRVTKPSVKATTSSAGAVAVDVAVDLERVAAGEVRWRWARRPRRGSSRSGRSGC